MAVNKMLETHIWCYDLAQEEKGLPSSEWKEAVIDMTKVLGIKETGDDEDPRVRSIIYLGAWSFVLDTEWEELKRIYFEIKKAEQLLNLN